MPIRALANTSSIMDRRRIFALCVQNNTDFTNFKDSIWLPLSIALIPAWKFDDNHNNRFSPMSAIRTHFLAKNPSFANLDRWKWKINSTTKFFCKKNSILVRKVEILCLEIIYDFQSKGFNRWCRGFFKKMPEIVYRVFFALPFLVRMRRYISSLTWILPDNIFIEKN